MLDAMLEQARQAGYDEGYEDGRSVRPTVVDLASRRTSRPGSGPTEQLAQ